ncbi:MAG: ribbon-helix-helix protein, CopG family [Amaricoccus sp.]
MNQHPTAITLDADLLAEIDAIAAASDRTRADVLREAIARYLDTGPAQVERIEAGLQAVREGRVIPAEDAYASLSARYGWPG